MKYEKGDIVMVGPPVVEERRIFIHDHMTRVLRYEYLSLRNTHWRTIHSQTSPHELVYRFEEKNKEHRVFAAQVMITLDK